MLRGLNLFWTLIILLLSTMVNAFSVNESGLFQTNNYSKRRLNEIRSAEKNIQGEYFIQLKLGAELKNLKQVVELNYCKLTLKTYHSEFGLLSRDAFDLRKSFPFKKVKRFKGSYGIFFGLKAHLKERSRLYFKTKKERDGTLNNFKKLSKLCKKRGNQDLLVKVNDRKKNNEPTLRWVSAIPLDEGENAGEVQTEGFNNYLANLDGRMSLKERYRSLVEAEKSILIQTFIFRSDESGKFFTDLLVKKKVKALMSE